KREQRCEEEVHTDALAAEMQGEPGSVGRRAGSVPPEEGVAARGPAGMQDERRGFGAAALEEETRGKPDFGSSPKRNKQKTLLIVFSYNLFISEGSIAGGTAGVVVETALYPIDNIKTRLQAARGGSRIEWKGLYSGMAGNLAGVLL
ncbi:hypothetical protein U9M48_022079, partial [Paspalum notatum var. saurae]